MSVRPLLDFVYAFPAPGAPVAKAAWFVGELCRPGAVIDLAVRGERALVAVVIDTCDNANDAAELVVLGFDPACADEAMLREALARAQAFAAEGPRSVIEVSTPGVFPVPFLEQAGFVQSYQLHEMERAGGGAPSVRGAWSDADRSLGAELHALVRAAFADVPGSFVPTRETFVERLAAQPWPTRVCRVEGRVAAFIRPEGPEDGVGTIGSVAVLPSMQGRGLGRDALREGMRSLRALGATRFRLDVAVRNTRALRLYESEGFATVQAHTAWVLPLR